MSGLSIAGVVVSAFLVFFAGMFVTRLFWTPYSSQVIPSKIGMERGVMSGGVGMMGHSIEIKSDADFLMGMIPHHQEAVDTAMYALTKTQDAEMKVFLQGIVDAQTTEINQMKQWHREWYGKDYVADQRYRAMMPDLSSLPDNQVIPAFLHGMIMHHMGAIEMARVIFPLTERDEIRAFAQDIIRDQNAEINRMLEWLSERAGYMPMMAH